MSFFRRKPKWTRTVEDDPKTYPTKEGFYAVMVCGDSESDGPHVYYSYPDYLTHAYAFRDEDTGQIVLKGIHDEEQETVIAWYGPIEIPPCDCHH